MGSRTSTFYSPPRFTDGETLKTLEHGRLPVAQRRWNPRRAPIRGTGLQVSFRFSSPQRSVVNDAGSDVATGTALFSNFPLRVWMDDDIFQLFSMSACSTHKDSSCVNIPQIFVGIALSRSVLLEIKMGICVAYAAQNGHKNYYSIWSLPPPTIALFPGGTAVCSFSNHRDSLNTEADDSPPPRPLSTQHNRW